MNRGKLFKSAQTRFRKSRFCLIEKLLRQSLTGRDHVTVLDAGGRPDYWQMLAPDLHDRVHITCLNSDDELSLYDSSPRSLNIVEVVGDACAMPEFSDNQFDLVHSNSVIEHVGSFGNMARFASETTRVGRAYYHQTPDMRFPIEPHYGVPFVHWLPDSVRSRLFTQTSVGYAKRCSFEDTLSRLDHTRIISRWMMAQFFPDATFASERFLLLPKSTVCYRMPENDAQLCGHHTPLQRRASAFAMS